MTVVPGTTQSSAEQRVASLLPWIREAGNPYFDFLFGGAAAAITTIDRWMRRPSSELYVERAVLLQREDEPVGGFIALTGSELNACRRTDMTALTMAGNRRQREEVLNRLKLVRDLFTPVKDSDFYLSKFWVDARYRGAGYAREVMNLYRSAGHRQGLTAFRLDVCADNERAIQVYRSFGFNDVEHTSVPEAGLRYLSMRAELAI